MNEHEIVPVGIRKTPEEQAWSGRWARALLPLSVGVLLGLPLLAKAEARRIGGPPGRSLVPAGQIVVARVHMIQFFSKGSTATFL